MCYVQVYGDSILKGVTLDENNIKYKINDIFNDTEEIENYSKFGCTVSKGDEILTRNLSKGKRGNLAFLEYGGNDSDFDWEQISNDPESEYFSKTPINEFEEKYTAMIHKIKQNDMKPVLFTLIPVEAESYLSWICRNGLSKENILKWLGDVFAIYRYQEQYSRKIEEIAVKENCDIIDLRGAFLRKRKISGLYATDGIHPSLLGQDVIKHEIHNYLKGC